MWKKALLSVVLVGSIVACTTREGTNFDATKVAETDDCAKFCNKTTAAGCGSAGCVQGCRNTINNAIHCKEETAKSWECAANRGVITCDTEGGFLVGGCALETDTALKCTEQRFDPATCKQKSTYADCNQCCAD